MDEAADELAALVMMGARIQSVLIERGLTLATAESCTGGLIGYILTETTGSSAYYVGGLISYTNDLKEHELGVDSRTLQKHGAVSAQACVAMADGARKRYGATIGLSVTGIAGPEGGSEQKPVGLTYVGVADDAGHDVRRNVWGDNNRHVNRVRSAEAALGLLLERLGTEPQTA
ncbi:MAG TPA: CinA family protein [Candidatus Limnocylindrales bacterium]|nr:CinA family protein [Candidatus Limnocylindrales bacterium]